MYAIDYEDFGTPAPADASGSVTVEIDGRSVTVPEGTSVMRAAALAGVRVPKLCATDTLKAFGSCRLCLCEIDGRKGYPASCTTTVAPDMKVRTESPKLSQLRRSVMELYLSDYPLERQPTEAEARTELLTMARSLGVSSSPYANGQRHQGQAKDESNPYFTFDPNACIVCSRCVRACDEIQGTFALTIQSRGFDSKVAASQDEPFLESECVSCGACVEACPTAALTEKSVIGLGAARARREDHLCLLRRRLLASRRRCRAREPTPRWCAWCRTARAARTTAMRASRDASRTAMPRIPTASAEAHDPQDASATTGARSRWDEAIGYAASEFKRIQAKYGRDSIGGITSSRCTNEETFLVQKLVRAGFGNNNVDTCARVCHSPTGYGLKNTLGESAGTQAFDSVMKADVIMIIGANPTDGHPVFASQMKRRLRQGAKLIVVDPRETGLVRSPHVEADEHLQLKPGTNVALMNALAHVVVTEGLTREAYVAERCETDSYAKWKAFVAEPRNSPEATESITGVPAELRAPRGAPLRPGAERRHLLRPRRDRAQPGHDDRHGDRESRDGHRQPRPRGRRRQPAARPEQRAGLVRHGVVPARVQRLPARVGSGGAQELFEEAWGVALQSEPGLRIPNMFEAALDGSFKGMYIQGEDFVQSDPNTHHVTRGDGSDRMRAWCRTCFSTRPPSTRTCSCRAPRSSRRTAPSPTPSGACRACAR